MGKAEREVQDLPLHFGAVTRTDELERLRVTTRGTLHHPIDERAGEALEA